MKKARIFAGIVAVCSLLCLSGFAKTHKTDIVHTDTIEYTLEEKDKLSAELYIDNDGLYVVRVTCLTGEKFKPEIAIRILSNNKEVYSFNAKEHISYDDSEVTNYYEFAAGLTNGEYKVEIENLTMFSSVSFKIETSFIEEDSIETFGNNSFEKATAMELKTKYYGGTTMADETDYYAFEMPYDGYAFVQMYSPQFKFFTLYDSNKNEIGSIGIEIDETDKIYELRTGLAKGKYFISIQTDEDYTRPLYTIEVNTHSDKGFEKEYNNTNVFAMSIESGNEYQGNLFGTDDIDIYTFSLGESSDVTIDFTDTHVAKDGHYKLTLSDGEKTLFVSDECGKEIKTLNLNKGTYFLTVSSLGYKRFTGMAYKIKVTSDKPFVQRVSESNPPEKETVQFSDVKSSDWFAKDLLEARKEGLINGLDGNTYNPKGNVTIAEIITMATRIHSLKNSAQVDFSSSNGKWYEPYIKYATDKNLLGPNEFEDFERAATRAETAHIFSSLCNDKQTKEIVRIPDVNENTEFHKDIYKLYRIGILKGNDNDGTFRPDDNLSRAEAAVILLRIHKIL